MNFGDLAWNLFLGWFAFGFLKSNYRFFKIQKEVDKQIEVLKKDMSEEEQE